MPTIKVKNIKTGQWEKLPTLKGDKGEPGVQGLPGKDYILTSEDKTEIGNNVKTDIQPVLNTIENKSEEAISIAKGANQSLVYNNYSEMITIFNNLSNDVYKVGQNILVVTLNVPDLWIAEILDANISYEYISDENFVDELKENGYVQIGYYKISALETQKVDLTDVNTSISNLEQNKMGKDEASELIGIPTDGIIVLDNDVIPEGYEEVESPNIDTYSLEETKTNGIWVDKKPIYRKVIKITSIPTNEERIKAGITSFNELITLKCLVRDSSDNSWRQIPWTVGHSGSTFISNWNAGITYNSKDDIVFIQCGTDFKRTNLGYITLEYTKTTD